MSINDLLADPIAAATRSNAFELNRLKKQLTDYEKELSDRDAQIQDLDKQLRAFLDNNYGLDEAVQEIRQLKGQLKLKDRQLEDVANYASKNELVVHELSDENEELRAKLGMDPKKPMTLDELRDAQRTRSVANQATIQILQKEVFLRFSSFLHRSFDFFSTSDRKIRRRTIGIETKVSTISSTSGCQSG